MLLSKSFEDQADLTGRSISGSTVPWEAWGESAQFTISSSPRITSLTANVAFPASTGTPITWRAETTGGAAPLQFKFWRFKAGSGWTVVQDWSSANTATWTPGSGEAGTYQLQVWLRNSPNSGDPDAWNAMEFTVANDPPVLQSLTANRSFPATTGQTITWTAVATGGTAGPLQYKFWRYNQGTGVWTVVQDYSPLNTWTWTPGYADAGTYVLQVWIRSANSDASYDTFAASDVWTVSRTPVTITSFLPDLVSPAPAATQPTWTVYAIGGSGPLEYQFWLYNVGTAQWTLVRSYSTTNRLTWSLYPAGTYVIQVWVRTVGSGAAYEAWANSAPFVVQ
jgi:hypothetical protein